jgi:hypothetical protein
MAKRLISLRELDDIEGLVEHHRKVQERIEADAAWFGMLAQDNLKVVGKATAFAIVPMSCKGPCLPG